MNRITLLVAPFLCLVATAALGQTATAERRFALPAHGNFVLQVPRDWKGEVRQSPSGLPMIAFTPGSGRPFQVIMTPVWPRTKDFPPPSRDQLRDAVEQSARGAKPQAVENELPLAELQGRPGPGFYFSATDRAPKDFKFLTYGIIRVGELAVNFTILTNDGQEAVVKQALDALRGATQDGV